MAAHDSMINGEEKPKQLRVDASGASLSWRSVIIIITILAGGGGGGLGFHLVTQSDLGEAILEHSKSVQKIETDRHETIDKRLDQHDAALEGISAHIGELSEGQHRQEASQEAHRLTERIKARTLREIEYDRLRRINENRLKKGKEPCYNLSCSN